MEVIPGQEEQVVETQRDWEEECVLAFLPTTCRVLNLILPFAGRLQALVQRSRHQTDPGFSQSSSSRRNQ